MLVCVSCLPLICSRLYLYLSSDASPTPTPYLQPSLRGGAVLATDFEDQAADLIDFLTTSKSVSKQAEKKVVKKLAKKGQTMDDLTKKELKKAIKKEESKIQKKIDAKDAKQQAKRDEKCLLLSKADCDDSKVCEIVTHKGESRCHAKPALEFDGDEEDFYLDSSEDLFDFEEDYDWDEDSEYLVGPDDEDDDEEEKKLKQEYKKLERKCSDLLSESECDGNHKCKFKDDECVPKMKKP